jgi:hypothetical protein
MFVLYDTFNKGMLTTKKKIKKVNLLDGMKDN